MALGFLNKGRGKNSDPEDEEYPDGTAEVVEETLENASKKKRKDDDESVDYSMSVDWGRKYKPRMTFASRSMVEAKQTANAKRIMKKVGISVASGLVVLSAASMVASFFVGQSLESYEAERDTVKNQVEALQPIAQYYDDFVQRQGAASNVLAKDVLWSQIQEKLKAALPNGAYVTNEQTRYGQVCASPKPFEPSSTIGCVSLDVTVGSYGDLGTLIDNLATNSEGLSDPYVTTTAASVDEESGESSVTASITFNFDATVISTKYTEFQQESQEFAAEQSATAPAPADDPAAIPADPADEALNTP